MGTNLPLWKDDEGDVRPEHQLTYGRVICGDPNVEKVASQFVDLISPVKLNYRGPVLAHELPERDNSATLLGDKEHHALLLPCGGYTVIFAPHSMFFSNVIWIKFSTQVNWPLAVATSHEGQSTSYKVFRRGQRLCSAWSEGGRLRGIDELSLSVYLGGKLISGSAPSSGRLSPEVIELLSHDVQIQLANEEIQYCTISNDSSGISIHLIYEVPLKV